MKMVSHMNYLNLNNIINDVVNGTGAELDIQGIDVAKCFDEMGYEETHNDMWDVIKKSDKFNLIAKLDEKVTAKVKTPVGLTEEFTLERIVLQGSVNAPIKCSIQSETLSSNCMKRDNGSVMYKYKGLVYIPPLQMVDDIMMLSRCGIQTIEANALLNVHIESKKLRLSEHKCYHMHISKKRTKCLTSLKVHDSLMQKTSCIVYLGDSIVTSGSCEETLRARELKAIGFISQIAQPQPLPLPSNPPQLVVSLNIAWISLSTSPLASKHFTHFRPNIGI